MKDITLTSHVVMDIRIHAVTMKEALAFAEKRIMEGKPSMIATANAEMIMIAQQDHELARILNGADLVVPDGAGVLWRKAGHTLPGTGDRGGSEHRASEQGLGHELAGRFPGWKSGGSCQGGQKIHGRPRQFFPGRLP